MAGGRWIAAAILAGSACSGRTGLLIEVATSDEALRVGRVDRLVFVVSPEVVSDGHAPRFVRDDQSSVTVVVTGRDLAVDPYRLLLSDARASAAGAPLLLAVLAYGDAQSGPLAFAALPPRRFVPGEVLVHRVVLAAPAAVELSVTGCVTWEGGQAAAPRDRDCDGIQPPGDCDDLDPEVSPQRRERCANAIDDDCDGLIDELEDVDGDGFDQCSDCDDRDPLVHPGAPEICDNVDNDCSGACDEGLDRDGDGLSMCGSAPGSGAVCGPAGDADCNDDDATIGPGVADVCDGRDDDCDGACDSSPADDADGDGFTTCGTLASLPAPARAVCGTTTPALVDCDDGDAAIHPLAHELCDGRDDDCDPRPPAAMPCWAGDAEVCGLGHAACDDDGSDGDFGPGPCAPEVVAVPVTPALCSAAASCATAADPFRCATAAAATWTVDCDLAVRTLAPDATRPARFEVCPDVGADLPLVPEVAGCVWQIVGGLDQERLRVGLAKGGPPAARLAACSGRFVVTALGSPLAARPDEIVILYGDLGRPRSVAARYRVTPRVVAACPAAALSCKIFQ